MFLKKITVIFSPLSADAIRYTGGGDVGGFFENLGHVIVYPNGVMVMQNRTFLCVLHILSLVPNTVHLDIFRLPTADRVKREEIMLLQGIR